MKKIFFNDKFGLTEAVLSGRKTQTRGVIKMTPVDERYAYKENFPMGGRVAPAVIEAYSRYQIGEVVAVAQAYNDFYNDTRDPRIFPSGAGWTNKRFVRADLMPHQIRITNVRVERLQDISDEDCMKEGIYKDECTTYFNGYAFQISKDQSGDILAKKWYKTPQEAYAALIDRIHSKGTWERNPLVFVYDFELVK